jgi:hypothetical protein
MSLRSWHFWDTLLILLWLVLIALFVLLLAAFQLSFRLSPSSQEFLAQLASCAFVSISVARLLVWLQPMLWWRFLVGGQLATSLLLMGSRSWVDHALGGSGAALVGWLAYLLLASRWKTKRTQGDFIREILAQQSQ